MATLPRISSHHAANARLSNRAQVTDVKERLFTLRDGLWVFADTLHTMTLPYPPPSLPPVTRLRVVK